MKRFLNLEFYLFIYSDYNGILLCYKTINIQSYLVKIILFKNFRNKKENQKI